MTPTAAKKIEIQRSLFDLARFEEVLVGKSIDYTPVDSVDAALARLGNDSKKFLEIINDGLRSEVRRTEGSKNDGWNELDSDGDEIGPFNGQLADQKAVNGLILNLAKTTFGYTKDASKDEKRAAKEAAFELVKATPVMRAGLAKYAKLPEIE